MNSRRGSRPKGAGALSIGALSRATDVPVETLRTWERRYGAPMPVRKPSGQRVYPAQSVDHMRRVVRLLAQGHRPAEILPLSIPVLIFGVAMIGAPEGSSAALLFLSALSLVSVAFCPFAAALALRVSAE